MPSWLLPMGNEGRPVVIAPVYVSTEKPDHIKAEKPKDTEPPEQAQQDASRTL